MRPIIRSLAAALVFTCLIVTMGPFSLQPTGANPVIRTDHSSSNFSGELEIDVSRWDDSTDSILAKVNYSVSVPVGVGIPLTPFSVDYPPDFKTAVTENFTLIKQDSGMIRVVHPSTHVEWELTPSGMVTSTYRSTNITLISKQVGDRLDISFNVSTVEYELDIHVPETATDILLWTPHGSIPNPTMRETEDLDGYQFARWKGSIDPITTSMLEVGIEYHQVIGKAIESGKDTAGKDTTGKDTTETDTTGKDTTDTDTTDTDTFTLAFPVMSHMPILTGLDMNVTVNDGIALNEATIQDLGLDTTHTGTGDDGNKTISYIGNIDLPHSPEPREIHLNFTVQAPKDPSDDDGGQDDHSGPMAVIVAVGAVVCITAVILIRKRASK